MKRFLTLLRIEGILALRCPDGLLFGVVMPIGILFLIGFVAGNTQAGMQEYTYMQSAFPSLLTIGICATAFMGLPATFSEYRDKKILKHFFVTPASPRLLLLVETLLAALTAIVSACMISLCATLFFAYHMEGSVLFFLGGFLLVLFSMYGIGMLIASLSPSLKATNIISSLIYFPMLFLSGATIPYELFPTPLQHLADFLPLTQGIQLLKNISLNIWNEQTMFAIGILVCIGCVTYYIAIRLFRWE